jgi:hypothetical protein
LFQFISIFKKTHTFLSTLGTKTLAYGNGKSDGCYETVIVDNNKVENKELIISLKRQMNAIGTVRWGWQNQIYFTTTYLVVC